MVTNSKLLLWDIDGTLIWGARQAAVAFIAALRRVYELPEEIARISYGGKTDGQIVRETLALHAVADDVRHERFPLFQQTYLAEFEGLVERMRSEVTVLPGVRAALAGLAPQAVHTLLTGNFQATARLKLDAAGLSEWFRWDCGAFGSDDDDRHALVPIALERAAKAGLRFDRRDVVVIGDTPHDISCARAGEVRVIAVATGTFGRDALAAAGPDALFDNLSDLEALESEVYG